LTGQGVVKRIYTDLAVIDVTDRGLELVGLAPEVNLDYVCDKTGCELTVGARLAHAGSG
jgi:acyl CoA:acetate/3-ketoacid CoA transferase beta subunit